MGKQTSLEPEKVRCHWCNLANPLYVAYHDQEWGVPVHDDNKLFEMLLLETFQAGLSWECVLNKREGFRSAFDHFDYQKIALYDKSKMESLAQAEGIIRNRLKISAATTNARIFMDIQKEIGSFDRYLWQFTKGGIVYECDKTSSSPLRPHFQRPEEERNEICGHYHHLFLSASRRHHQLSRRAVLSASAEHPLNKNHIDCRSAEYRQHHLPLPHMKHNGSHHPY